MLTILSCWCISDILTALVLIENGQGGFRTVKYYMGMDITSGNWWLALFIVFSPILMLCLVTLLVERTIKGIMEKRRKT